MIIPFLFERFIALLVVKPWIWYKSLVPSKLIKFLATSLPKVSLITNWILAPPSVWIKVLLLLDNIIPHLHLNSNKQEGIESKLKKTTMLVLAVTLHNVPEGMAVGVILSAFLNGSVAVSSALALSLGIAIQNFPEGAIISMPLKSEGMSKKKAFLNGTLSGIVEPIAAVITILLTSAVSVVLPYLLSFAAGAMIYVVVEELIPEANSGKHSNISTIGLSFGFVIMMILDVALG